jgi:hypothetical protein
MPNGGRLTIETSIPFSTETICRSASRTGRQLIGDSSGTEPVSAFAQLLLLQHAHRIL